MLIIQLNKTDGELLYNGDYFKMIAEKDGTIYDDEMIANMFTEGITTPLQNYYAYMFNVRDDYVFYDLEKLEFIQGGFIEK